MDPTGTGLAIYYNYWRNVEIREVCDCFKELPPVATDVTVKQGDVLWKRCEPYAYAAGKVYGFEQITVTDVHLTDHGTQVDYRGSVTGGMSTIKPGVFYQLSDECGLAGLVAKHGDKITSVHESERAAELADIRKSFEAEWDARGLPR